MPTGARRHGGGGDRDRRTGGKLMGQGHAVCTHTFAFPNKMRVSAHEQRFAFSSAQSAEAAPVPPSGTPLLVPVLKQSACRHTKNEVG